MHYLHRFKPNESLEILGSLVQSIRDLNPGPLTRHLCDLALNSQYADLLAYELEYPDNARLDDLIYARQVLGFYTKNRGLSIVSNDDRRSRALQKFIQSEEICEERNRNLVDDASNLTGVHAVVEYYALQKISSILGDVPPLASLSFAYGPGATTSTKSDRSNFRCKLSAALACSHELMPVVGEFLSEVPMLVAHHSDSETDESWMVSVEAAAGNLMFVPKTAMIDRSIMVEPILNGLFQKGVGSYMKERLRLHGVDLFSQQGNRDLAKVGSLNGEYATIDLSMASDTVSRALVEHLLPQPWSHLLRRLRTGRVNYKGPLDGNGSRRLSSDGSIVLEKFSSMGNAFTFELESLIFYSLAWACKRALGLHGSVRVYGDDIIVPTGAYPLLKEVLELYGFVLNKDKSFAQGKFRESCGADYFFGVDIRPFYVRENLTVRSLFVMHNWFLRAGETHLAREVQKHIPKHVALYGPDGYGDGHLVGSYTLRQNRSMKRAGWCGGYFDTYSLKQNSFNKLLPGDWLCPAYSVYTRMGSESPTDPDVIRGSRGFRKVSLYTLATGVFR